MQFDTNFFIQTFFATLGGVPVTMAMTLVSLLLAVPGAFVMALLRLYRVPVARQAVQLYISFVQGTPAAVQILLVYSLAPSVLAGVLRSVGSQYNIFELDPIVYAYIIFTFNTMAVLSELLRSALQTVDPGQLEAAYAVGLSTPQAYIRIVLPQALVAALPNLCNTTVNLIKGTSLAFLMSVKDVTAIAKIQASFGYNYLEAYLDIWIVYLILCGLVEAVFRLAEWQLSRHRPGYQRKRSESTHAKYTKSPQGV